VKKLFVFFFALLCALPHLGFSDSSKTIQDFFGNDHEKFVDYHWLAPREIFDQWSNGSRFMASFLLVTYQRKHVANPIFESFKDYVGDTPLSWNHKLNYRHILFQSYQKEFWPFLNEYEVRTNAEGNLLVYHKNYNFIVGTFEKDGQFDVLNYDQLGQINIDLWKKVHYDPWAGHMFVKAYIEKESMRKTKFNYPGNADDFYFKFKNDVNQKTRVGSLNVVVLPGFKNASVVFTYNGHSRPISKNAEHAIVSWSKETVTFDVKYEYDPRLLWMDKNGVLHLEMTEDDFFNR